MKNGHNLGSWSWVSRVLVVVVLLLAGMAVFAGVMPASARIMIDDGGDDDGGGGDDGGSDEDSVDLDCLGGISAWLSAEPPVVLNGESATLSWQVYLPPSCPAMTFSISSVGSVGQSGSQMVQMVQAKPQDYVTTAWELRAHMGLTQIALDWASVRFISEVVTITSNNDLAKFKAGIARHYAHVEIANNVVLNLDSVLELDDNGNQKPLYITPSVQIIGGRSATHPGPLLYTTLFWKELFAIGTGYVHNYADNVRISGIRLQGPTFNRIADQNDPAATGITVYSSVNVEIDNNELFGWPTQAVSVGDPFNRISSVNFDTVRVHDNYIHNNERYRTLGYGVNVGGGAYALIAKNVFDFNRHAIASDGAPGSGYYAVANLVLEHGGRNYAGPPLIHTHQFDVHGSMSCYGFEAYCGDAGEYFSYTYNTILYTNGTAIKVRGKPSSGAFATRNVFAHSNAWEWPLLQDGALAQNDPGENFYATQNTFGAAFTNMLVAAACDFSGDGALDDFLATGATWWYRNNAFGPHASAWRHLRTDTTKRHQLIFFGDLNSDGICDVKDTNGVVYLSGVTPVLPPPSSDPVIPSVMGDSLAAAESTLAAAGYVRGTVSYVVDQSCAYIGMVTRQSPTAGTYKTPGTVVDLTIGKQPSTPCGYAQ